MLTDLMEVDVAIQTSGAGVVLNAAVDPGGARQRADMSDLLCVVEATVFIDLFAAL